MNEVTCPYCGEEQEIYIEDDILESDELNEQECSKCEKIFLYSTEICFHHSAYKAPCKNGGEHKLKKMHIFPEALGVGRRRCEYCNEIIMIDEKAHEEAMKEYIESLNQKPRLALIERNDKSQGETDGKI